MNNLCDMLRKLEIQYVVDAIPCIYIDEFYNPNTTILLSVNENQAYDHYGNFVLSVRDIDEEGYTKEEPFIRVTFDRLEDIERLLKGWKQ